VAKPNASPFCATAASTSLFALKSSRLLKPQAFLRLLLDCLDQLALDRSGKTSAHLGVGISGVGDAGVENGESSSLRWHQRTGAPAQCNDLILKRALLIRSTVVAGSSMRALRMVRAAACDGPDAREPLPRA